MVKFKDFSRPLSAFQVVFKAILIFKDFQDCPVYSSTFQACANPDAVFNRINSHAPIRHQAVLLLTLMYLHFQSKPLMNL